MTWAKSKFLRKPAAVEFFKEQIVREVAKEFGITDQKRPVRIEEKIDDCVIEVTVGELHALRERMPTIFTDAATATQEETLRNL